jgi:hypothetical protein
MPRSLEKGDQTQESRRSRELFADYQLLMIVVIGAYGVASDWVAGRLGGWVHGKVSGAAVIILSVIWSGLANRRLKRVTAVTAFDSVQLDAVREAAVARTVGWALVLTTVVVIPVAALGSLSWRQLAVILSIAVGAVFLRRLYRRWASDAPTA